MSATFGEPTATDDSVRRYGTEAAAEFARVRAAQSALMDAFDALSRTYEDHASAAEGAWAFNYLWGLVDDRRISLLKTEPTT